MDKVVYDLDFNEEMDLQGVLAISTVENPAIKSNFLTLSEEIEDTLLSAIDDEKRLLVGPVLIPDIEILRKDGSYIRFSKEVVRKCMEKFFENGYQNESTLEHGENKVEGMTVVESWIVEDKNNDKINMYGIDVPEGTWMCVTKCSNDEIYQLAKDGKIKGFSIEGAFGQRTLVKETLSDEDIIDMIHSMAEEDVETLSQICEYAEKIAESREEAIEFVKKVLKYV